MTAQTQIKWVSWALWLLLQVAMPLGAEEKDTLADSLMSISLTDGTRLEGIIIQETETHILVETLLGLEIKVPRTSIVAIKKRRAGAFFRPDPNYTRLMFAPTGRPLRRGDRYFFDYYVFFPGIAYGFTDRFGVAGGPVRYSGVGIERADPVSGPQVRPLRQRRCRSFRRRALYECRRRRGRRYGLCGWDER